MKHLSTIILFVTLLSGCNGTAVKENTSDADFIFGKWKNTSEENSFIEFTKTGDYIVWINNEAASDTLKFKFDPNSNQNFKLIENRDTIKGILEIIDKDKIKLSIFAINSDKIHASSVFVRVIDKK